MRYLKLYENFEDIDKICQNYVIHNYTINKDGSVDVDDGVGIVGYNLWELPLKFGKVNGSFNCEQNKLTSLIGSPTEVFGIFCCGLNQLVTLVGGPKIVRGNYHCSNNVLVDVYGFPENFNPENFVYYYNNPVVEIINLVNDSFLAVKFIKWLNEFDAIREKCTVVEQRLEEAYYMTTKKELTSHKRKFNYYTLI